MFIIPIDENLIINISSSNIVSRLDYKCGHCVRHVSGIVVNIYARERNNLNKPLIQFILCPSCVKRCHLLL